MVVQTVGFGPAALGLPVAADRHGALHPLLDAGVAFLDDGRGEYPGPGERLNFVCDSNSPAEDFLAGIRPGGALCETLESRQGLVLQEFGSAPVPLCHVAGFLHVVRGVVQQLSARAKGSDVSFGRRVASLRLHKDGTVSSEDNCRRTIARSAHALLATGAEEVLHPWLARRDASRTMVSGQVLGGTRLHDLQDVVRTSRDPFWILGSSHSSFAVAALLVDRFGDLLDSGRIVVMSRNPVPVYYPSARAADVGGHARDLREIDPETGEVNRFTGIRSRARALYFDILSGRERRVAVRPATPEVLQAAPDEAVVIQATGYDWRQVPVLDSAGKEIPLKIVDRQLVVDCTGSVLTTTDEALPSLSALGHGVSRRGVPRKGAHTAVNVFHGRDADQVVSKLSEMIGL